MGYLSTSVGEQNAVLPLCRLAVAVLHVAEGVTAILVLHAPLEVVGHAGHRGGGGGGLRQEGEEGLTTVRYYKAVTCHSTTLYSL